MSGDLSALIEVGSVGAPHGVRGWIKLHSHTDPPERLLEHRRLRIGRGDSWREFRIQSTGRSGGALTAKLEGIDDRDQAQTLCGAEVRVPRSELPKRSHSEFYRVDLIGCEVVTQAGAKLGTLTHFIETPAHALMVVRGESERWIPAVPKHLRRVDVEGRTVTVDWDDADWSTAD